ncbi:synaptonemal complex central element protein 1-like [Castor canadensis]|uniref:Synaptonemal complex central element protein 1-like n=1 Tax=Castor canadensis TaxID=51338 RepID=A0AC58L2T0_CASCN
MLNKCLLIDSSRAPMPACSPCASAWGRLASVFLGSIFFLSSEGNLEPQIKDLINRINELQQGKQKSSKEVGEARDLQGALHKELDSLNGEKEHLEEVLSKKQEALMILQQHCQERESEAQWMDVKEQLEDLTGQHKDLWEFHMLKQRLAQEIRALEQTKEQLLVERKLVGARLQEVELWIGSGCLETELEKFGGQTQRTPETRSAKDKPAAGAPAPAVRSIWSRRWSWP